MSTNTSPVGRFGLTAALAAVILVQTACGDVNKQPVGTIGHVKGFAGMVAADEPRAVHVARDILSAGGNAADAAVGLYFTLSVTLPSTASLGGGGSCLVHDKSKKLTEALDFVAPPSSAHAGAQVPNAVPASVRGMYALYAKHGGKLRWEVILAEAERLARHGNPVSRALAVDLAQAAPFIGRDPGLRALFVGPNGRVLGEGDLLVQQDLAASLSRIRRSPGEFYTGPLARELASAVASIHGSLAIEDLRDIKPEWRETLKVKIGNETAHFAPPPAVAGATAAQIVAALAEGWAGASAEERHHLLAEIAARVSAARASWMQPHGWTGEAPASLVAPARIAALVAGLARDRHQPVGEVAPAKDALAGTGFAIMDSQGMVVTCGLSNYGLFGNGRIAPGTGIVLAAVPGSTSGPPAIGPAMLVNNFVHEMHFAGTASGGVTAPSALAAVLLDVGLGKKPLGETLALPRLHHAGNPDAVFVEAGERGLDPAALTARGHKAVAVEMPSRVNALSCPAGRWGMGLCEVVTDPRGRGLALVVGKD